MPNYKLVYFDIQARGELPRLLFAAAKQKYEDKRVKPEEWLKLKETLPLKSLPVLYEDGVEIVQSMAIVRHLARKFGLFGHSNDEATVIDIVLDTTRDIWEEFYKIHFTPDPAQKRSLLTAASKQDRDGVYHTEYLPLLLYYLLEKKLEENCAAQTLPLKLGFMEKKLTQNGKMFIAGNHLSAADLALYDVMDILLQKFQNYPFKDKHPKIVAHRSAVESVRSVKDWLDCRSAPIVFEQIPQFK